MAFHTTGVGTLCVMYLCSTTKLNLYMFNIPRIKQMNVYCLFLHMFYIMTTFNGKEYISEDTGTDVIMYASVPIFITDQFARHIKLCIWFLFLGRGSKVWQWLNIVAAFQGMHVSPAKHSYAWLPRKCDRQTDRQTEGQTDARQSYPYMTLCFAGDTLNGRVVHKLLHLRETCICFKHQDN